MAFLDKVLRFKKKPFKNAAKEQRATGKEAVDSNSLAISSKQVGTGQYAHVLISPHISERAQALQVFNKYVFQVKLDATKHDIARAIFDLYGVKPVSVKILRVRGKGVQFGRTFGTTAPWKKAIITLPREKTIDVYKK